MQTIALVDDDKVFLSMTQGFLTQEGYKVLIYDDPVAFRKSLLASSIRPDLIVTDVEMPFETGIEMIYDIALSKDIRETPIIFLSGKTEKEFLSAAFESNVLFIHYLLKPVNYPLLLLTIQKMLLLQNYHRQLQEAHTKMQGIITKLAAQNKMLENTVYNERQLFLMEQERLQEYIEQVGEFLNRDETKK